MATIACLGWGSLIWDPQDLPLRSEWFDGGPLVQVEFARQSNNGRMTLVLDPGTPPVPSLWAIMKAVDLNEARDALGVREGIAEKNWDRLIGAWQVGEEPPAECVLDLDVWARLREVDGVVWTALGPKFNGEARKTSGDEVVAYLSGLTEPARSLAENYVRNAPSQIDTPFRRRIVAELGWGRS